MDDGIRVVPVELGARAQTPLGGEGWAIGAPCAFCAPARQLQSALWGGIMSERAKSDGAEAPPSACSHSIEGDAQDDDVASRIVIIALMLGALSPLPGPVVSLVVGVAVAAHMSFACRGALSSRAVATHALAAALGSHVLHSAVGWLGARSVMVYLLVLNVALYVQSPRWARASRVRYMGAAWTMCSLAAMAAWVPVPLCAGPGLCVDGEELWYAYGLVATICVCWALWELRRGGQKESQRYELAAA